jgi:uncharacterized membrane protein
VNGRVFNWTAWTTAVILIAITGVYAALAR